jgi:hypothetical protein
VVSSSPTPASGTSSTGTGTSGGTPFSAGPPAPLAGFVLLAVAGVVVATAGGALVVRSMRSGRGEPR